MRTTTNPFPPSSLGLGEKKFSFMSSRQEVNGQLQGIFYWLDEGEQYKALLVERFSQIATNDARREGE